MKKPNVIRSVPDINEGLSTADVRARTAAKMVNRTKRVVGKSYLQIFVSNIFTFFNLLGIIVFALMLLCGSYTNMMFVVIIFANTAIGIFQEIRSKLAVEKLSIVSEPTAEVVRDGAKRIVATRDIVLDDIILYSAGKQICCDSRLLLGEAEVNESMLTGESEPVKKKKGDILYSGSFVVSGNCTACCVKVGKDNYVEQLSSRVKKAKTPDSQLMKGIRRIIKFISVIVLPLGILTFLFSAEVQTLADSGVNLWSAYWANQNVVSHEETLSVVEHVNNALKTMCGAMIGMVPSGMVLLTSVALAVAALKLARKKVLVRELPCIEMLARVDTLCLDKTGTITDGSMTVEQVIPLKGTENEIKSLVASVLHATGDDNMTAKALSAYVGDAEIYDSTAHIAFSSARKYSAATLTGKGTVAIGAAEFMFKTPSAKLNKQCDALLRQGLRVLAVGITKSGIKNGVADNLEPIAVIALQDTIRSDAPQIIQWFKDNNVAVKVISGDNPQSVSVIARKAGIADADKFISLEGLDETQVAQAANEYTVFGRVTPEQKAVLVRAMKQAGHTVAMTGDGINDILAMRESDCAISVGCGTDAAKTVANLVLTDNMFGSMPDVVAQGRQVVNNIQNSSSLFLMKTSMTVLTTILCLLIGQNYPFEPQHMYAAEFFVIGISSFLLALKPNHSLITGKFIPNTLKRMLPSGLAMFGSVGMSYAFAGVLGLTDNQLTTVAMLSMSVTGLIALWILLYPFGKFNLIVGCISIVGTAGCYALFPSILNLIAVWTNEETASPLLVAIDGYDILFVIVNSIVMGAIIIGLKFLIKYIERKLSERGANRTQTAA